MAFSQTVKNFKVENGILYAECYVKGSNTLSKPSNIKLDDFLGNEEGSFRWGWKEFTRSAEPKSILLKKDTAILQAKLKPLSGQAKSAEINLDERIANIDGVLKYIDPAVKPAAPASPVAAKVDQPSKPVLDLPAVDTAVAGTITRESSSSSTSSATTAVEKSEYFSSSTSTSTSTSTTTTKTTHIRTMQMDLHESCKLDTFKLVDKAILVCMCLLATGEYRETRFNLDSIIGNINGVLTWGKEGFSRSSKEIRLEKTILKAKCKLAKTDEYVETEIDLGRCLRNDNGVIIYHAFNAELSRTLSEVPWMKFKVVAEPDFAVIARHPVIQTTLASVARSTVEHVTKQFEIRMAEALALTIAAVTISAQEHIEQSMVVMTKNLAAEAGRAHLYSTHTDLEYLHGDQPSPLSGKAEGFVCELPANSAKPLTAKA